MRSPTSTARLSLSPRRLQLPQPLPRCCCSPVCPRALSRALQWVLRLLAGPATILRSTAPQSSHWSDLTPRADLAAWINGPHTIPERRTHEHAAPADARAAVAAAVTTRRSNQRSRSQHGQPRSKQRGKYHATWVLRVALPPSLCPLLPPSMLVMATAAAGAAAIGLAHISPHLWVPPRSCIISFRSPSGADGRNTSTAPSDAVLESGPHLHAWPEAAGLHVSHTALACTRGGPTPAQLSSRRLD